MSVGIEEYKKMCDKLNRGKAAASEHELQTACVRWFRYVYPDKIIISIPNGAKRTLYERRIALQEGLTAGVPDLFIPHPAGSFHGLWIEMKNGKAGRLSEPQVEMIARLKAEGYVCAVCRTQDEFINTIKDYLE